MEIKPLRNARLEIFKTLNNLNPEDMSEIFIKYKFYILTAWHNIFKQNDITKYGNDSNKYGNKSLRTLGPTMWNFLSTQKEEGTVRLYIILICEFKWNAGGI